MDAQSPLPTADEAAARRARRAGLAAVLLAAGAIRLAAIFLGDLLPWDGVYRLQNAIRWAHAPRWQGLSGVWEPAHWYAIGALLRLYDAPLFWVDLLGWLCGVGACWMLYSAVLRWSGRVATATWAGLLLAVYYGHIYLTGSNSVETYYLFFLLGGVNTALAAGLPAARKASGAIVRRPTARATLAGLAIAAAMLLRHEAKVVAIILAAWLALQARRAARGRADGRRADAPSPFQGEGWGEGSSGAAGALQPGGIPADSHPHPVPTASGPPSPSQARERGGVAAAAFALIVLPVLGWLLVEPMVLRGQGFLSQFQSVATQKGEEDALAGLGRRDLLLRWALIPGATPSAVVLALAAGGLWMRRRGLGRDPFAWMFLLQAGPYFAMTLWAGWALQVRYWLIYSVNLLPFAAVALAGVWRWRRAAGAVLLAAAVAMQAGAWWAGYNARRPLGWLPVYRAAPEQAELTRWMRHAPPGWRVLVLPSEKLWDADVARLLAAGEADRPALVYLSAADRLALRRGAAADLAGIDAVILDPQTPAGGAMWRQLARRPRRVLLHSVRVMVIELIGPASD
ncbi:MAG: hypothetical protein BIFFINMI_03682 [Phycisphaerae bacterium]|nr:hypothetical protein [Phycisphaerae bacterium]